MRQCSFEAEILSAARGPELTSDLTEHLDSCESCRESLRLQHLMNVEAAALIAHATVTTANAILRQASLRRNAGRAEKASLPVKLMEAATMLIAAMLLVFAGASLTASGIGGLILYLFIGATAALVFAMWFRARLHWRRTVNGPR